MYKSVNDYMRVYMQDGSLHYRYTCVMHVLATCWKFDAMSANCTFDPDIEPILDICTLLGII